MPAKHNAKHPSERKKTTKGTKEAEEETCFLCLAPCTERCSNCNLVNYCSEEHFRLHRQDDYCFPYKSGRLPEKGRVLFATRDIKPLELVLIDPGTVVGPNYKSKPVCLQCLRIVETGFKCPTCHFPMCGPDCADGFRHRQECEILSHDLERTQLTSRNIPSHGYAHVTPLRMLLLMESAGDKWLRTNQLMDHLEEKDVHPDEWSWYDAHIMDFLKKDLKLASRFTNEDIKHAIGLLNVNAVCLQFPKMIGCPSTEVGKGCYPIFAIMSHHCICNARYFVDPNTFNMYVRARVGIKSGEELTVQYLSALNGTHRRRKKIREEWYFDCTCKRCSDPTECGTYISALKCIDCQVGSLLPSNSLDYSSKWTCVKCKCEVDCEKVECIVDYIEDELNQITNNSDFQKYQDFINEYSGTILHPNHFLLTTARRNLMQYLCYSMPDINKSGQQDLEFRVNLCKNFYEVLHKIDPGWSELAMFGQRELHFTRLSLLQRDFALGSVPFAEFSVKSRDSIQILKKIDEQKKMITFKK